MPRSMPPRSTIRRGAALAALLGAGLLVGSGAARAVDDSGKLTIERIDMKPTRDGFYDATVGFLMSGDNLGKDGKVAFSIAVSHVHDADEAITKVHEPVKALGEALQRAYTDIHREP